MTDIHSCSYYCDRPECIKAQRDELRDKLAQPEQEPEYWNVIDPAGNIVASETDAIRGWARVAGSYKPTVEGLLGFHDQGWRVLPKVTPPAAQRKPLTFDELKALWNSQADQMNQWDELGIDEIVDFAQAFHGIKENT
jgi:hypothetical protein